MTRPPKKPAPKLCPVTLLSVAKELRQSHEVAATLASQYGKDGKYVTAAMWQDQSQLALCWAEHFEGQAKTARSSRRSGGV